MGTPAAYGKGWKAKRRRVLERDGWICHYCHADLRSPGVTASVDHVISVVDLENAGMNVSPAAVHEEDLVACCSRCNSARGARMKGRRALAVRVVERSRTSEISGSPWDD